MIAGAYSPPPASEPMIAAPVPAVSYTHLAPAACSAEPSERGADHEHGRNGEDVYKRQT